MANAVIDLRQANRRELPAVCVVTGREADGVVPVKLSYSRGRHDGWLLVGAGAWFVANAASQAEVTLPLPFEQAAWRALRMRWRRLRMWGGGTMLVGLGLAFVALQISSGWAFALGLLSVTCGGGLLVHVASRPGLPSVKSVSQDGYVELGSVHPGFAAALGESPASR